MREIKFRGMELGSRAWVYGYLVPDAERGEWQIAGSLEHVDGAEFNSDARLIDPATVGQYTGLKDRNGVEIYEGDVCLVGGLNLTVSYRDMSTCFQFDTTGNSVGMYYPPHIEITGNIYEPKP